MQPNVGRKTCMFNRLAPQVVREDEMRWLQEVVHRLGTTSIIVIRKKAHDGDGDAQTIVTYCETARWKTLYDVTTKYPVGAEQESLFIPDQFLSAVARHTEQMVALLV